MEISWRLFFLYDRVHHCVLSPPAVLCCAVLCSCCPGAASRSGGRDYVHRPQRQSRHRTNPPGQFEKVGLSSLMCSSKTVKLHIKNEHFPLLYTILIFWYCSLTLYLTLTLSLLTSHYSLLSRHIVPLINISSLPLLSATVKMPVSEPTIGA